jgi:hypothetical protein
MAITVAVCTAAAGAGERVAWTLGGSATSNDNLFVQGTEFTTLDRLRVMSLGWYDDTAWTSDGLDAPHAVGLFAVASGTMIASATVPAGTAAARRGAFRFVEIAPVTLAAGRTFVVAGVAAGDPGRTTSPGDDMIVDDAIELGPWRTALVDELAFPGITVQTAMRFMGPNLGYELVPVCGDIDGSGQVGFDDLVLLLGVWGPCGGCAADLDGSGDVGFDDLVLLLGTWGTC